jgi:hypothetical protein
MSEPAKSPAPARAGGEWQPVPLLERIKAEGRVWGDLANQYGVTNPDPPWKTSLEGMCDALGGNPCDTATGLDHQWLEGKIERGDVAGAVPLPALERRWEEDELADSIYKDVPFPERQLLALTHSLIRRGLVSEEDLARRMKQVHERLNAT